MTKKSRQKTRSRRLPPHETVLAEATRIVNGPRAQDYGKAIDDATRWSMAMNAVFEPVFTRRQMKGHPFFLPADYAIVMLLTKINREMNRHKRDNFVDIAGYAQVGARICGDDE